MGEPVHILPLEVADKTGEIRAFLRERPERREAFLLQLEKKGGADWAVFLAFSYYVAKLEDAWLFRYLGRKARRQAATVIARARR